MAKKTYRQGNSKRLRSCALKKNRGKLWQKKTYRQGNSKCLRSCALKKTEANYGKKKPIGREILSAYEAVR